jgi:hypothetical protein
MIFRFWAWWLTPIIQLLGDGHGEECGSRPAGVKISKTPISKNRPGMMAHGFDPSFVGGIGRRTVVQDQPKAKSTRSYLKNYKSKKGLGA